MSHARTIAVARLRLASTLAAALLMTPAVAHALPEWIGGSATSNNWSDHLNWLLGDRPDPGDEVHFYGTPARTSPNISQDYDIDSIFFQNADVVGTSSAFTFNGNSTLTVQTGIFNTCGKTQTVNCPLKFTSNGQLSNWDSDGDYGQLNINSVNLNGNIVDIYPSSYGINITGTISGTGGISVGDPGTVTLSGSNTFSGTISLNQGTLSYQSGANLGALANSIVFQPSSGATATLKRTTTGTTSGPVTFSSGEGRLEASSGIVSMFTGAFSGSGAFGKTGAGTVVLGGNTGFNRTTGNTGNVSISEGTLEVAGQPRLPTSRITVSAGATLQMDSTIVDLVGSISGAGSIQLGSGAGLNIGTPASANSDQNGTGTFSGVISGVNNSIIKQGNGTLVLTGSNSYTGTTSIVNGKLAADNTASGSSATGSSSVTVSGNGTLVGSGSIAGPVTLDSGGRIAPSAPATPGSDIGYLAVGPLTMNTGAFAALELTSTGDYDSVEIIGDGALNGTLALSTLSNQAVPTGKPKQIMHFDGTRTGTFATVTGMAMSNGKSLAVTYTDHTVVVTVATPGDATLDGAVNFDDLIPLAQNYNHAGIKTWSLGDFTGDGVVNFDDLIILAQHYNKGAGSLEGVSASFAADWALAQSLVPEPTTLAAIGLLSVTLIRRRAGLSS